MKKVLIALFSVGAILGLSIHFFGLQIGLALFNKPIYMIPPSVYRLTKDALTIMEYMQKRQDLRKKYQTI